MVIYVPTYVGKSVVINGVQYGDNFVSQRFSQHGGIVRGYILVATNLLKMSE